MTAWKASADSQNLSKKPSLSANPRASISPGDQSDQHHPASKNGVTGELTNTIKPTDYPKLTVGKHHPSTFKKVLIANRGAIASRIIRTLRELGVKSVAVYAEADAHSLHVEQADQAYALGSGPATATYLDQDKIIAIAKSCGAEAIHPGYGFLSENADFVERCEKESIAFIGPTAEQIQMFGLKHRARELAEQNQVPLVPGSGLLTDLAAALEFAGQAGFPLMLKSTAGGGGIGMQLVHNHAELEAAFDSVKRLSANNFANDGVFLESYIENARHIEIQVIGDGMGKIWTLGERDCSSQRRHQKVIEESPAANLPETIRRDMATTASRLMQAVSYRNAGTVEYIYDANREAFYFLEVNTRLQVEHGVTEMTWNVDLVALMLAVAANKTETLQSLDDLRPTGHAIQVRLYAEDPSKNFQPCAGLLTQVEWPAEYSAEQMESTVAIETGKLCSLRIDHWIEAGLEVTPLFDPMLAKVIVKSKDRQNAISYLRGYLESVSIYGVETNLDYVSSVLLTDSFQQGTMTTRFLNDYYFQPATIDVITAGTQTTIQDYPGRTGYWDVGVPPSGPFDGLAFRLGNQLLGNPENAAGLEITLQGPTLRFNKPALVVLTGAEFEVTLDGQSVQWWALLRVEAGQQLKIGKTVQHGARGYLLIRHGFQCPVYLGSRSTFTLGQFGGHGGRALHTGDVLHFESTGVGEGVTKEGLTIHQPGQAQPLKEWTLRIIYGPHGAPDFFTEEDINRLFSAKWEVHYQSSRTGVRLIGPKPQWSRSDGGEAGMHPSNIHDNAYALGSIDFTGDMPVILGPDGPSLGGFVCPATVIRADLWILGQLKAGDRVRFQWVSIDAAVDLLRRQEVNVKSLCNNEADSQYIKDISDIYDVDYKIANHQQTELNGTSEETEGQAITQIQTPILHTLAGQENGITVVYRLAGDCNVLVEYGEQVLDLRLRLRVHALMQWLHSHPLAGMLELTPGIRSLQIHYDPLQLSCAQLMQHLLNAEGSFGQLAEGFFGQQAEGPFVQKAEGSSGQRAEGSSGRQGEGSLQQTDDIRVPSRIVYLPLSWNDSACQQAVEKYMQTVRSDAPWCPDNIEFIRRINGLQDVEAVKQMVFSSSYVVMGLGDVYLGAPVATPLDPSKRLVTTKYNPARTWTAENSVGIGGAYLCVYGMEGPGGYQFIGRTLQMWNRYHQTREFDKPWLLRFFDQIRFYEVSEQELKEIRSAFPKGKYPLRIEETEFSLQDYECFLRDNNVEIRKYSTARTKAFQQELDRWVSSGQINFQAQTHALPGDDPLPDVDDDRLVSAPVAGSLWRIAVKPGDKIEAGQQVAIIEAMKMEIEVTAKYAGVVAKVFSQQGQEVHAGQAIITIDPAR